MKHVCRVCAVIALVLFNTMPAHAGPYTDDLSKCLVNSTSQADRVTLVRWIFLAISQNPKISIYVKMTPSQRDHINHSMADLFTRLMTQSCKQQTHDAYAYEGNVAIQQSFQVLGQVAARGIFAEPKVEATMSDLMKYVDTRKLGEILKGK